MEKQKQHIPFRRRHALPLRGIALAVVLSVPVAMYYAAQVGNQPLLWGLIGIMVLAMALAIWVG